MLYLFLFLVFILLFIVGMTFLRTGLFNASASSLKLWLVKLTGSPLKGLLVGTIVTGILQSSSAVMVITIGLISARMLTFRQSIGIILGTNIGTTFTTEFITFNIDSLIVPMAILGTILLLLRNSTIRSIGTIFLGLSFIFTAMNGFEYLATPISELPFMNQSFIELNNSHFLSVIAGIIITAIIQSSTATTGIVMGFLTGNVFGIDTGIAIMLGANIGTCVTAYIASIGSGEDSKLCAYAHIWINFLGVIVFFPFITLLSEIALTLAVKPEVQLAHISVIFNCISSIALLPFAYKFGDFIIKTHGRTALK
jgi:phosphate:Na+ symporter